MNENGVGRWALEVTNGVGFTFALFVRDRFELSVAEDIPTLAPPVGRALAADLVGKPAAGAWDLWWDRVARARPGTPVRPDHNEALATLWDQVEDEARWWETEQMDLSSPPYRPEWTSSWMEDHLPANGKFVSHSTEVLGVEGQWHQALAPTRLLVSLTTFRDHAEMDDLLRSALGALLTA
jgi:hypothetical protein